MTFLFWLGVAIVCVILGMIFLLRTPQQPVIRHDDDAIRRAQLDTARRLGKSPSVIRPRPGNGRLP